MYLLSIRVPKSDSILCSFIFFIKGGWISTHSTVPLCICPCILDCFPYNMAVNCVKKGNSHPPVTHLDHECMMIEYRLHWLLTVNNPQLPSVYHAHCNFQTFQFWTLLDQEGLSTGEIVGIVVGVIFAVVIIIVIIVLVCRKKKGKQLKPRHSGKSHDRTFCTPTPS